MAGKPLGPVLVISVAHQSPPQNYAKYRRRKLWKTIRTRVLGRDRGRCFRCCGKADVVHHRSYGPEVMEGLADEYLISLCDGCHTVVEFDDEGNWRPWSEKERVLLTPDTRTDFPEPVIDLRRKYTPRPPEWERMNNVQRVGWLRRKYELQEAKRKKRPRPITTHFKSRRAAESAAFKVLDKIPALKGRFREDWDRLYLALMTQGYELFGNAEFLTSGLQPKTAQKHFKSMADSMQRRKGYSPLSKKERRELEALAIWNSPKLKRAA
jgi:hypothetical protein